MPGALGFFFFPMDFLSSIFSREFTPSINLFQAANQIKKYHQHRFCFYLFLGWARLCTFFSSAILLWVYT